MLDYEQHRSVLRDAIIQALDESARAASDLEGVIDQGDPTHPPYQAALERVFKADQRLTELRDAWTRLYRAQPQQL